MVVAQQFVDLAALKHRHPLAEVVTAAGVQLRGQGRVRQGLCPFHDETAGQLHGVRRYGPASIASAVVPAATCWTSCSAWRD